MVLRTLSALRTQRYVIDGTVARRTSSASEFGARLDTVSDFVFMTVALIKFLPHLHIPVWLWIWIGIIVMIKLGNVVWGFIRTKKLISPHTILNKVAGLFLFLLPVTISFVDLTYTLPIGDSRGILYIFGEKT